ncbi:hypothetical protein AMR42_15100 [Limnothrix sp. PR1529]|uniref:hypothetical protein n=1 Tax=Limnothrix sp. PR1529 TaxID=1704291 RepID=UPI000C153EE8|nr:hypothetical protein [Limnothrix sp. PR1529]PIB06279.1 hypothetical protein AMR42_15100 [Limnothrix sp. PR1529]
MKPWHQYTLSETWAVIVDHCPVKFDPTAARNLAAFAFSAIATLAQGAIALALPPALEPIALPSSEPIALLPAAPPVPITPQNQPRRPWATRTAQLDRAIAAAWEAGHTTYDAAIAFVRVTTGKGCSRRAIARWKAAQA